MLGTATQKDEKDEKKQAVDDLAKIHELREYYRRNFAQGQSDKSFLEWVEDWVLADKFLRRVNPK